MARGPSSSTSAPGRTASVAKVRRGGFATKTAAEVELTRLKGHRDDGAYTDARGVTVAGYLTEWLDRKVTAGELRPTTARSYRQHLGGYLVPHLGRLPLGDLRVHHVDGMLDAIRKANATSARPVGPATQRRIVATLRSGLSDAVRFTLPPVASRRQFDEQLVGGTPGERRVVLDDLVGVAPNGTACCDALVAAQTRRPTKPGVTRSAVIVVGPDQMSVWKQVFAAADGPAAADSLPVGTVTLRRYDAATLRVWSLEGNRFQSEDRRAQLLRVTGGWPMLVERAAELVKGPGGGAAGVDESEALRVFADELSKPDGAAAFVGDVGLTADEDLVAAFEGVLAVIDSGSLTRAELEIAAGMTVAEPAPAVECLIALQVFDNNADGSFVPERLLLASWPHRAGG